jgi:hypothetical protein
MGEAEIRNPLMSGHCAFMGRKSPNGIAAHARCAGGQRANPQKIYQPCPCPCHFPPAEEMELFECGECGGLIIEAPRWPLDVDGDTRYTHMDLVINDDGEVVGGSGRALGEDCNTKPRVSGNEAQSRDKDCSRCGDTFTPKGRERICPGCKAAEVVETVDEFEALMADLDDAEDEDDEFADLDDLDFDDV